MKQILRIRLAFKINGMIKQFFHFRDSLAI